MTKKKSNPLWFKRKTYGWGWVPSSWQGWATVIIYVCLVVGNFYRIDAISHSGSDTLISFIPETIILTIILIAICLKKGEPPRWQWGRQK